MGTSVIRWSLDQVGPYAMRAVLGHPDLELIGLSTHSEDKEGGDSEALLAHHDSARPSHIMLPVISLVSA